MFNMSKPAGSSRSIKCGALLLCTKNIALNWGEDHVTHNYMYFLQSFS